MLTPRDVADRLGWRGRTGVERVRRLILAGKLAALNLSAGAVRARYEVAESDLARFMASAKVVPGGQRAASDDEPVAVLPPPGRGSRRGAGRRLDSAEALAFLRRELKR